MRPMTSIGLDLDSQSHPLMPGRPRLDRCLMIPPVSGAPFLAEQHHSIADILILIGTQGTRDSGRLPGKSGQFCLSECGQSCEPCLSGASARVGVKETGVTQV